LEELVKAGKIPHNKIGVTTVGEVRKAGGKVIPDGTPNNQYHCTLSDITPEQAEKFFTPTRKNPVKSLNK